MLRGKRIACVLSTSLLLSTYSTHQTPFHALATEVVKNDNKNNEMVLDKLKKFQEQYKKDIDKKKTENKKIEKQNKDNNNGHKQTFVLTYYGATYNECGNSKFITASGIPVQEGHIAVPKEIPFGSKIIIDGNEYVATDRGNPKYICILSDGSIRVDIFVSRLQDESEKAYEKRIARMGTKKVVGELYIKEK